MKLKYNFFISIATFIICTLNASGWVMADTSSDHALGANEAVNFGADVDNLLLESERIAVVSVVFDAGQKLKASLMRDSEAESSIESSLTNSQFDAHKLAKPATNTTDYALSVGDLAENNLSDLTPTVLGSYTDNLGVEKIALETDALRESSTLPEPSSIVLFTLGLLGLGLMRRQKKCI